MLAAMVKAAGTTSEYRWGVINAIVLGRGNAIAENVNGRIERAPAVTVIVNAFAPRSCCISGSSISIPLPHIGPDSLEQGKHHLVMQ
jgi:hypothetical protein